MVLCNQLVIQNTSKQVTMDRLKNTGLVLILCYKYGEISNGFSLLYESRFLQRCNIFDDFLLPLESKSHHP